MSDKLPSDPINMFNILAQARVIKIPDKLDAGPDLHAYSANRMKTPA